MLFSGLNLLNPTESNGEQRQQRSRGLGDMEGLQWGSRGGRKAENAVMHNYNCLNVIFSEQNRQVWTSEEVVIYVGLYIWFSLCVTKLLASGLLSFLF